MVSHGHAGDPNIQKNAFVEELPTSIITPPFFDLTQEPVKTPVQTPVKTPVPVNTPIIAEPIDLDMDFDDDGRLTEKAMAALSAPRQHFLSAAIYGQPHWAIRLKNDTDINNILPTRTRGKAAFDIDIDDGTLNTKVNDTTAQVIPVSKAFTEMTKNQLIAFINAKSETKHGSLITKDKVYLLQLAQAL